MISLVLIIPAILHLQANKLFNFLGYGDNTFSIPCSANEQSSITHYGARTTVANDFILWLENITNGELPTIPDMQENDVKAVFNNLIVNVSENVSDIEHFINVLNCEKLQMFECIEKQL